VTGLVAQLADGVRLRLAEERTLGDGY